MKRIIKSLALAAIFSTTIATAVAAQSFETSFTYQGLYKSLKTASANEFSQIGLNFYLLENETKQACSILDGYISDGNYKMPLTINQRGRMLLPIDKKLKQDKAAITIITDKKDRCHLSMQVEVASFELTNSNLQAVNGWAEQMTALYSKLAGWPGRYFMPNLTGLNFTFSNQDNQAIYFVDVNQRKELLAESTSGKIYLPLKLLAQLSNDGKLEFSSELIAVTPKLR